MAGENNKRLFFGKKRRATNFLTKKGSEDFFPHKFFSKPGLGHRYPVAFYFYLCELFIYKKVVLRKIPLDCGLTKL